MIDGLVKSQIYVVVNLKRLFAVPHVQSNHRFRYYAANRAFRCLRLSPESISATSVAFYESIMIEMNTKMVI